jgi:2-methylcitrate dehydratase PrpD
MVATARYEDIPEPVIDLAKRAILDTLAVTIAGSGWEVSPAIAEQVAEWGGAPQATVLVHGYKVSAPMAAFANGVMARAIDMGDVHETGGHVTEWNVPAMLSVLGIAGGPVSGKDFLAAYVTGAEVGVRASAALNLVRYHTTWGCRANGTGLCVRQLRWRGCWALTRMRPGMPWGWPTRSTACRSITNTPKARRWPVSSTASPVTRRSRQRC